MHCKFIASNSIFNKYVSISKYSLQKVLKKIQISVHNLKEEFDRLMALKMKDIAGKAKVLEQMLELNGDVATFQQTIEMISDITDELVQMKEQWLKLSIFFNYLNSFIQTNIKDASDRLDTQVGRTKSTMMKKIYVKTQTGNIFRASASTEYITQTYLNVILKLIHFGFSTLYTMYDFRSLKTI
jgi:hypothetical protein